jgi:hypothetical protein
VAETADVFTGRVPELQAVARLIASGQQKVLAVYGVPGAGKC